MLGEEPERPSRSWQQWAAMIGGSLAVTALTLLFSLAIGWVGYEYRSRGSHQGRLERLVEKEPTLDVVAQALADEGGREVARAADPEALARLAEEWGGGASDEVLAKGARWSETRAFLSGDFVYVLYFDAERVLRDSTCVRR